MHQGYGQFCPVALAAEVLAERWTLLIVRELLNGSRRFNEIRRGVPRLSPTLLKQRLLALKHAGIVDHRHDPADRGSSYSLTAAGLALEPVVMTIGEWGHRWARDLKPADLDPAALVWAMHRRLDLAAMPKGRTVIEFEFVDVRAPQRRFWLIHCDGDVDVCLKDPGFETTVRVSTRIRTLVEVWRGFRSLREEVRAGTIQIAGTMSLQRAFPQWLLLSHFASIEREAAPGQTRSRTMTSGPP
jgi:DNA-binding HxlR family transcriptional regulator